MQKADTTAAKIAEYLLEINAIKLSPNEPFTWTSGWKSPIYSDNRLSLSHPHVRNFIKKELGVLINTQFSQAEAMIGVATAGIAPGAIAADELNLPFGYVRSEAKKHGANALIKVEFYDRIRYDKDIGTYEKPAAKGVMIRFKSMSPKN